MKELLRKILILTIIAINLFSYTLPVSLWGNYSYATDIDIETLVSDEEKSDNIKKNEYFEIESKLDSTSRYKGILLANLMSQNKNDFVFTNFLNIEIRNHKDIESLIIDDKNEMVSKDETVINLSDYLDYRGISVNAAEFESVFSDEGKIIVLDENNEEIAIIDKNLTKKENKFELDFIKGIKNIRVKIEGIKADGKFKLELKKAITQDLVLDSVQIRSLDKIRNEIEITGVITKSVEEDSEDTLAIPESLSELKVEENDVADTNDSEIDNTLMVEDRVDAVEVEKNEETDVTIEIKDEEETEVLSNMESNIEIEEVNEAESNIEIEDVEENILEETKLLDVNTISHGKKNILNTSDEIKGEKLTFENTITLEDTSYKMSLFADNNKLSTESLNNVNFYITIRNNGESNEIFQNPRINIDFPADIKTMDIKDIKIVNGNGIEVSTWEIIERQTGEKTLEIDLLGINQTYNPYSEMTDTKVLVNMDIGLNEMLPNTSTNINYTYTNEIGTISNYEKNGLDSERYVIQYTSRNVLLRKLDVSGFNENEVISNYNNEFNVGKIAVKSGEKNVKVNYEILNNYNKEIEDVSIIGRIPAIGAVDQNGKELENLVNTKFLSEVNVSGILANIFYSEKNNAEASDDSWVQNPLDISEMKSFKIVVQNGQMKKGEKVSLDFDIKLPADIDYNQSLNGIFIVDYKFNDEDITESSKMTFETEKKGVTIEDIPNVESIDEGNSLSIATKAYVGEKEIDENTAVNEGDIVTYDVYVKNNTENSIGNVSMTFKPHLGNMYYYYSEQRVEFYSGQEVSSGKWKEDTDGSHSEEKDIFDLSPNEEKVFTYKIVAKDRLEDIDDPKVYGIIETNIDKDKKEFCTIKNDINDAEISIKVQNGYYEYTAENKIYNDSLYKLEMTVKNLTDRDIENIPIEFYMSKLVKIEDVTQEINNINIKITDLSDYNLVKFNINEIAANEEKRIQFELSTTSIDLNKMKEEASFYAESMYNDKLYKSNKFVKEIYQSYTTFDTNASVSVPESDKLELGEQLVYTLNIKNTGLVYSDVQIEDLLPENFEIQKVTITYEDGETVEGNFQGQTVYDTLFLDVGKSAKVEVVGEVVDTDIPDVDYTILENQIVVSNHGEETVLPKFTHSVNIIDSESIEDEEIAEDGIADELVVGEEELSEFRELSENVRDYKYSLEDEYSLLEFAKNRNIGKEAIYEDGTYSIKGKIFIDKNNNGSLDDNDTDYSNVEVRLYKDINEEYVQRVFSDNEGNYEFYNLDEGEYIIAIVYDESKYQTTSYMKNNVLYRNASYGTNGVVLVDGTDVNCAISDVVALNKDYKNYNFGFIEKDNFDLSIDSRIKGITLKNDKQEIIEEYDLNENSIDSLEIGSDSKEIEINYEIEVKNTGNIEGYVNQLRDQIPEGFEISNTSQSTWSLSADGKAYTDKLVDKLIAPDESEIIDLVITKKVSKGDKNELLNKAEIVSTSNFSSEEDKLEENNNSENTFKINKKTSKILIVLLIILLVCIVIIFIYTKYAKGIKLGKKVIISLIMAIVGISAYTYKNQYVSYSGLMTNWTTGAYSSYLSADTSLLSDLGQYERWLYNEGRSTLQCVEWCNLDSYHQNNWNQRYLYAASVFNKNGKSPRKAYSKARNGGHHTETNKYSAYMAYIGYYMNENTYSGGKTTIAYLLRNNGTFKTNYQKVMGGYATSISFSAGQSTSLNYTANQNATAYMSFVDNNKDNPVKVAKASGYDKAVDATAGGVGISTVRTSGYKGGESSNIINNTYVLWVKKSGGSFKKYKGTLYYKHNGWKTQNIRNGALGDKYKYQIGVPSSGNYVEIKVVHSMNLYQAKACHIAAAARGDGQSQVLIRGTRIPISNEVIWKVDNNKLFISKGVYSVDGNTGNKTYVEKGCNVVYKIGVKGTITSFKLTDSFNQAELKYVGVVSSSGLSYSGISQATGSVSMNISRNANADGWVTLKFEVISDNYYDTTRTIRNNVEATVSSNIAVSNDSVLKAYADVYMKTYKVDISITNTPSGAVEIGNIIKYKVVVKNNGHGGNMGEVRNVKVSISIPSCVTKTSGDLNYTISSLGLNGSDTHTIEVRVDDMPDSGKTIITVAKITEIQNHHGKIIYNSSINLVQGTKEAQAKNKIKEYRIHISKTINKISYGSVTDYDGSGRTDANKASTTVYAETGDKVTYKIKVTNSGTDSDNVGNLKSYTVTDKYNSAELEYVSVNKPSEWNLRTNTAGTLVFDVSKELAPTQSTEITVVFKVKKYSKTNDAITNKVTVSNIKNVNDKLVDSILNNQSVTSSQDTFYLRVYKVKVIKSVAEVSYEYNASIKGKETFNRSSNKTPVVYVETGDIVSFKMEIVNLGNAVSFGSVKFVLEDLYNKDEIEYVGADSGVTVSGGNGKLTISSSNLVSINNTYSFNIRFRVKKHCKINEVFTNTTNITSITNRSNSEEKSYLVDGSVLTSLDSITIRKYTSDVIKDVVSIGGVNVSSQSNLTTEVGDIIVYKITVKNTGVSKELDGKLYSVDISDMFKTNELEYVSTGNENGWSLKTTGTGKYIFVNTTGIDVNKSSSFTVTFKNVFRNLIDNLMIVNTAEIQTTNAAINRNNVNIRDVLNGNLKDTAEIRYLTYHLEFRNYISISNRSILNNQEKYDNPVVIEKGDVVDYTLNVKNTGETNLYKMRINDLLDNGLENKNVSTNGIEGNPKIYKKVNGIDQAREINSSRIKVNTLNKQFIEFEFTDKNDVLKPNETLIIVIRVNVTKSNMYLWNLQNEANILSIKNKNDVEIISANPDILNRDVYENKEYVRLNELIMSGFVWEDADNDGVMDDSEEKIPNVAVNLIDVTNGKMVRTFTNESGFYTFSESKGYRYDIVNGEAVMTDEEDDKIMVLSNGRVVKATNKEQTYGNYYSSTLYREYTSNSLRNRNLKYPNGGTQSDYIDYYIRFDYNGSKYRATEYANKNNLNLTDYSAKEAYHKDSNAVEFNNLRSIYRDSLEVINYNNAMNKSKDKHSELKYNKQGHESKIIDDVTFENTPLRMSAYSFADGTKNVTTDGSIDFLWLNESISDRDNGCYVGETEYLKEIGLGLKRQVVDLELEKDLFEVKITEKGEQSKYRFDQGNNASASRVDDSYRGEYVTGGINNEKNYDFKLYKSDYEYRAENYKNEAVQQYMEYTELDIEVTYKITITNNSELEEISKDERRNVYGVVNEITDYYPEEFKKYNSSSNSKIIKLYDRGDNGAQNKLVRHDSVVCTEAWYGTSDYTSTSGDKIPLTINNTTAYGIEYDVKNGDKTFEGYNKLYITGLQNIVLDRGESENIYIRYTVDKTEDEHVKINNGNSVSEINSYSIYENRQKSKSLGYIDDNSNPGNVGFNGNGDYISKSGGLGVLVGKDIYDLYENDSYKTGVRLVVGNDTYDTDSERAIQGFVWDDARSETITSNESENSFQYVGDGKYGEGEAVPEAKRNTLGLGENAEKTDSFVGGVRVQLIELIEHDDGKVYEEDLSGQKGAVRTYTNGTDGKYVISGFTPGKYIVRYTYGHADNIKTQDNSFDENEEMLIYNGQEYKSTTYNARLDLVEPDTYDVDSKDGDNVLTELTGKERGIANKEAEADETHRSDARDDEIMRLDSSSYTEYVNNKKSKAMQNGVAVTNQLGNIEEVNIDDTRDVLNKTSVYADTPAFPVRIEDETYAKDVRTYYFEDYKKIITRIRYMLDNIDFGIQYRPEEDIDIRNYITNIKVTTESGETIYDLNYDLYDVKDKRIYLTDDAKTKRIASTKLNEDSSKGINNQQTIRNDYKHGIKGLVYLNMDVELLVGTKINISYITNVNNISEIDRYAKNLEDIQYVSDAELSLSTPEEQESFRNLTYEEETGYEDNYQYVATGTARNILYNEFIFIDENIPTENTPLNALSRETKIRRSNTVMKAGNYYGRYLGNAYYTIMENGEYNAEPDVIATTKIAEVLDYVDNDMTLDLSQNTELNNYIRNTSGEELVGRGMIENYKTLEAPENWITILDNKGSTYNTKKDSRLAMVVDDRISSNDDNYNEELKNKSITRFLKPESGYADESSAYIYINTSKTLSVGDVNAELAFDNFAEIVGYRTETGRITTLQSNSSRSGLSGNDGITIGDIDPEDIPENELYIPSRNNHPKEDPTREPDIDMTETVTLSPPTGKYKRMYYIKTHKGLIRIIQTTLMAMIMVPIAYLSIKKIKTKKKFYK